MRAEAATRQESHYAEIECEKWFLTGLWTETGVWTESAHTSMEEKSPLSGLTAILSRFSEGTREGCPRRTSEKALLGFGDRGGS
jgi:hypothetical protein